jgi:hypothetical protein
VDWNGVRAALRGKFVVERDEPEALGIRVMMTVEEEEIRQDVGLAPTELHGRPWLVLIAPVCFADRIDPNVLVKYEDLIPSGALVLRGDMYLLRDGVLFESLTSLTLAWTVAMIAHEAAKVRLNLAIPDDADLFSHYAE